MGTRLLVDENLQARRLVGALRGAGHDVLTASEAGLDGASDDLLVAYAHRESRSVLTRNVDHFRSIHDSGRVHEGILAVFEGSQVRKNMSRDDIVRAIGNLEAAGIELAGQFIPLNAWK